MKIKKFCLVRFCLFVFCHTHIIMMSFSLSPVVQHHVEGIVYEVADGEADEGVAGGGEGDDQVVLHLRSLQVQLNSQTGQLEDNPTTDRRCNYRLISVPAVGRLMVELYKEEYQRVLKTSRERSVSTEAAILRYIMDKFLIVESYKAAREKYKIDPP